MSRDILSFIKNSERRRRGRPSTEAVHIRSKKGRIQRCRTQTWFEVLSIFLSSVDVFKVEETGEVKTFSLLLLRVMCDSLLSGSSGVWPTAWLSLLLGKGVTTLACPNSMLSPASTGQMPVPFSMGRRGWWKGVWVWLFPRVQTKQ